jgi:outer membrane protein assembly factor BamB
VCYDLLTGSRLWEQRIPARYAHDLAGEGPRATPTIEGDRCYTQGATGRLQCLDLATGAPVWSADVVAAGAIEGAAKVLEWGMSASPCLAGPHVLAGGPERSGHPTASVVAFDKTTGDRAWRAGTSGGAFSSPLVAEIGGQSQLVYFGPDAVAGYSLGDGATLWSFPWRRGHPHVCMPLLLPGGDLVVSSGYGTGSARLHVARAPDGSWSAAEVWRTNRLKAKFTNLVHTGGFIYGLDDGVLACLDAADGSLRWRDGKYRHGQVILAGALLLVMAEDGDVVLIDPHPDARRELTRFTALEGKTWNPPALAGRFLVVRNDLEAACYRLPVDSDASP